MTVSRSENMSRIRSRNTVPEVALRQRLWASGLRFRVNYRTPGGRADIAFPGRQVAVFLDGCFWHGCPEHYVRPRSSSAFWDRKLADNVERDRRQTKRLIEAGWTIIRLWEHHVREDIEGATALVSRACAKRSAGIWPEWRVVRVQALDETGSTERRHLESLLGPHRRHEDSPRLTAKIGRVIRSQRAASRQQACYD